MTYHNPVLLSESINGLNIKPNGVYVDVTFGGGGHSKEIIKNIKDGFLFSFDQDEDALKNKLPNLNFKLIRSNFKYIKNFLKLEGITKIDGLIADLGISSHQIDIPERGFAYKFDSSLDMRMNTDSSLTAINVVNEYTEKELSDIFFYYGDFKDSKKIAKQIFNKRNEKKIISTYDLIDALDGLFSEKNKNKYLARIFQAIRIEVNDEINSLKKLLNDATELLKSEGRLVVISYHSLEDRLVKNLINKGSIDGESNQDFFGRVSKIYSPINKKVIIPNDDEGKKNKRSRSAKLRIAEKI